MHVPRVGDVFISVRNVFPDGDRNGDYNLTHMINFNSIVIVSDVFDHLNVTGFVYVSVVEVNTSIASMFLISEGDDTFVSSFKSIDLF